MWSSDIQVYTVTYKNVSVQILFNLFIDNEKIICYLLIKYILI